MTRPSGSTLRGWRAALSLAAFGVLALTTTVGCRESCEQDAINRRFYRTIKKWYLWNDDVPELDPKSFDTSQEMVEEIRYREDGELIDRWSYVSERQSLEDYFQESQRFGFGFLLAVDEAGELRIAFTDAGGPADQAGVARGDTVVGIGGESLETIVDEDLWDEVLGPDIEGTPITFELRGVDGELREVDIVKGTTTFQTVPIFTVLEHGDRRTGYVYFSAFVEKSVDELNAAFSALREEDIDSLVIDVRYNGGGLISVAQVLGSLILPHEYEDQSLVDIRFNDDRKNQNRTIAITAEPSSVQVREVVFISGFGTASASEMVMEGTDSYISTKHVGEATRGKPLVASVFNTCNESLSLISARLVYPKGPGEYYDGLEPDCWVGDDYDHALGDPKERRLAAALTLLEGGDCPAPDFSTDAAHWKKATLSPRREFRPVVEPFARTESRALLIDDQCGSR